MGANVGISSNFEELCKEISSRLLLSEALKIQAER